MGQIRIKQAIADNVGSIIFSGAGNKLSENNSNLFWDNTNTRLGIRTGDPFNDQVGYAGDTDYASILVIKTANGRYGYNHNTGAVEIATYIDTTFTTVEAMIGTTSTHGFGLFTDDLVRLKIDSTGKVGINTGLTALTAQFETYGSGTTSATYGLKIHNSTGTSNTLIVRDDQRVGIRTASPTATLQVHGSSTSNSDFGLAVHNSTGTNNGLVVSNAGLVGIGTTPSYRLHVLHDANNYMYYNPSAGEPLTVYSSTTTIIGFRANRNGTIITMASTSGGACYFDTNAYYDFYTNSTGTHAGRINSSGNWGIGTTTINARMQVKGLGTTSATYSLQVHNSTESNYALVVRDDTRVGIGTGTPSDTLHIVGTFKLVDGNQASGKVLESDVNGVGTWTTPSVTSTSTTTLTNKRITKRVAAVTSSATPSFNTNNGDIAQLIGLAVNITNASTNLTGTPNHGDLFCYEITDNGTARTITWGASFSATTLALPTTTVISTLLRCLFQWNSTTSKWDVIAVV